MESQDLQDLKNGNMVVIKKWTNSKLEAILRYCAEKYYNSGENIIDDDIFDLLKEELEKRNPKSKFLKEVGAPPKKDKTKLPYPMMSLDKMKDIDEIEKFLKKHKGPYVISDKLDGVSALIHDNKMYSRGDGIIGQDISNLKKYTTSVSPEDEIAVRGELIITKKNFEKIKNRMKNGRNAVAGQVNAKHPDMEIIKLVDFVAYNIIHPLYTQIKQYEILKKLKFNVAENITVKKISIKFLTEYLLKRKKESLYEIDGIVITDSSKAYESSKENPEHSVAFKINEYHETEVQDVLWEASKDGYLVPRIKIKPLHIQGVTIEYATAFNAKFVQDNELGPKAVIRITRSGDVIPYIVEVLKKSKAKMPTIPYKWSDSKVNIIVTDIFKNASQVIKVKGMEHFFKTMGIKSLGEGNLKKFVENGYDTIFKILDGLKEKKGVLGIDGFGIKLINKIEESITEELQVKTLAKLMAASNIFGRGLGSKKLLLVLDKYPNVMEMEKKTLEEKILVIDGFSHKTTNKFISNLEEFKKFYNRLNKYWDLSHLIKEKIQIKVDGIFEKMNIVFTGFRNKDIEKFIELNGGKITSTISSKTNLLIYEGESSKTKKAKELGIEMIRREDFQSKHKL